MTSKASRNATSLPVSEAGPSRFDAPDGQTQSLFGPEVVLANPFPSQARKKALKMPATSGLSSCALSRSDALQACLESKLRPLLRGSDLCEVIWKPWVTPWGQCLSRPRARVRTTCETGSGLWATLRATDGEKGGPNMKFGAGGQPLPAQAAQSTWLTPSANEDAAETINGKMQHMLTHQAKSAIWPTALAQHANGTPENFLRRKVESVARTGRSMGIVLSDL